MIASKRPPNTRHIHILSKFSSSIRKFDGEQRIAAAAKRLKQNTMDLQKMAEDEPQEELVDTFFFIEL